MFSVKPICVFVETEKTEQDLGKLLAGIYLIKLDTETIKVLKE